MTIVIPGKPHPLQRARHTRSGHSYDTEANKAAKAKIAILARQEFKKPLDGPVSVNIHFWIPRPKSHYGKSLKPTAPDAHTQKPDIDNLVKTVFDALNGIAWNDDAQVVSLSTEKTWADIMKPSTFVLIEEAA